MLIIERATLDALKVAAPPPDLTVSEWSDKHRRLSPEAAAEPGRWRTERAPFQREIMDSLNDPVVQQVVIMSSSQVGKTEILLNVIGYYVHQDPAPMFLLQPTLDIAEAFSKDRLAPMIRDTEPLRELIADSKSRDSGNTLLHKKFPAGHITLAGANSPASLASRPIRIVLCDEVDRYPASAGTEGDPIDLITNRTKTFWNRKIVLTSTPTIKGESRIEDAYEDSDKRRFHCTCPHCGDSAPLNWARVKWPEGEPIKAFIFCVECGAEWSESARKLAISGGKWVSEMPFNGTAGFHLNELYSPWSTPGAMAVAFLKAKAAGTERLKTWINTALGESWQETGESADDHVLLSRVEDYPAEVPSGAKFLTLGADIQQDRIEAEVVGWNETLESWSVDYLILPGDTSQSYVWLELEQALKEQYVTEKGGKLSISSVCIDSGFQSQQVYAFCKKFGSSYVYPIKGMSGMGRPVIEPIKGRARRISRRKSKKMRPEIIGVDEGKLHIMRNLQIPNPGPGYCHFSVDRDKEYFSQLTAEQLLTKRVKGRASYEWKQSRPRNEALDCRVYAYAALLLANPDWDSLSGDNVRPEISDKKKPNSSRVAKSFGFRERAGR